MGLFGASQYESEVEKATSEKNVSEQWDLILEVCDKAGKASPEAKEYLKAILKRINNPDPHISLQAVTLLDACVKNCGKKFHVEVASREFEREYIKLIRKNHPKVIQKLKESLKRWAENEFKNDQQLDLIPTLYTELKNTGTDFVEESKPSVVLSKDPNVVQTQEEEDQIAKAIELSLKETSGAGAGAVKKTTPAANKLYPTVNMPSMTAAPVKEPKRVRALYDFEAAEDNELTFNSGEIVFIIDDSDPNWWKGSNQRGEGLFPANFVTSDLSMDSEQLLEEKRKKIKELDDAMDRKLEEMVEPESIEIDESKIDRLLHLLHEADPTNPEQDTKEMLSLEKTVNNMVPLIDKELERVDKKHAQLTQLSSDLVEALNLYHTLMREPQYPNMNVNKVPYGFPSSGPMPPTSMPPGMGPHSMMGYSTLPHECFIPQGAGNMLPRYNTLPHPQMHQQGPQSIDGHNSMPPLSMQMPPPPQMHQERPRQPGPFPPPQELMMGVYMHPSIPHSESQGPQSHMFMPTTASNSHMM